MRKNSWKCVYVLGIFIAESKCIFFWTTETTQIQVYVRYVAFWSILVCLYGEGIVEEEFCNKIEDLAYQISLV